MSQPVSLSPLLNAGELVLPTLLATAYQAELTARGLTPAFHEEIKGATGGATREESLAHFASRFLNSATRIQVLLVDPNDKYAHPKRTLFGALKHGHASLLDVPSGAGASSISLLASVSELRSARLIPTLPVTVDVRAADISPTSLEIVSAMFDRLKAPLAAQGIVVNLSSSKCDLREMSDVVSVCDDWLSISNANEYLVLIGNFSGTAKDWVKSVRPSFTHIAERISNRVGTIVWVEPATNSAKGMWDKFKAMLATVKSRYWSPVGEDAITDSYSWRCPIRGISVPSNVSLIQFAQTPPLV